MNKIFFALVVLSFASAATLFAADTAATPAPTAVAKATAAPTVAPTAAPVIEKAASEKAVAGVFVSFTAANAAKKTAAALVLTVAGKKATFGVKDGVKVQSGDKLVDFATLKAGTKLDVKVTEEKMVQTVVAASVAK